MINIKSKKSSILVKSLLSLCIITILTLNNISFINNTELRFVMKLQTPGPESPKQYNSTSDILHSNWTNFEHYTETSLRRLYALGLEDRNGKYGAFLSNVYSPKELLALVTPNINSQMSTNAYISGFFKDTIYNNATVKINNIIYNYLDNRSLNLPIADNKIFTVPYVDLEKTIFNQQIPLYYYSKLNITQYISPSNSLCKPADKVMLSNTTNINKNLDLFYERFAFFVHKNITELELLEKDNEKIQQVTNAFITNFLTNNTLTNRFNYINQTDFYYTSLEYIKNDLATRAFSDDQVTRIGYTLWYKKVLQILENRINNDINNIDYDETNPKFIYKSISIFDFIGMQVFYKLFIDVDVRSFTPGSAINIELRRGTTPETSREYIVYIYIDDFWLLDLTFAEFKQKISEVFITDEEIVSYCKLDTTKEIKDKLRDNNFALAVCLLIFVLLCIITFFAILYFSIKAKKEQGYKHVYDVDN